MLVKEIEKQIVGERDATGGDEFGEGVGAKDIGRIINFAVLLRNEAR